MKVNKIDVGMIRGNVDPVINDTHHLKIPFRGNHAETLRSLAFEVERIDMLPEQEFARECESNEIDVAQNDQADREYIAGICL
jgi:hypothetical protein